MKHFTDEQIGRWWAGGPKEKETFLQMLQHMNECTVCRDRTWDYLEEMQKQHAKMHAAVSKMMHGVFGILTGKGPNIEEMKPEFDEAVLKAINLMQESPHKIEWTGEELFGIENFDLLPHLKRCNNCGKMLAAMKDALVRAMNTEPIKSDQDKCSAAGMLQRWFDRLDERLAATVLEPEAPDLSGSGGRQDAFCT